MKKIILIVLMLSTNAEAVIDSEMEVAIRENNPKAVELLIQKIKFDDKDKSYYLALANEIVLLKRENLDLDFPYISGPGPYFHSGSIFLILGSIVTAKYAYDDMSILQCLFSISMGLAGCYLRIKSHEKSSRKIIFPLEQIYLDSLKVQNLIKSM